jgi:hypothetical protein
MISLVEANYQRGGCINTLPRELTMATQANQPVTMIPAQPTTLLVGARQIQVDDWPLAQIANEKRSVEVVGSDDLLVIEPKRRSMAGQIVGVAVSPKPWVPANSNGFRTANSTVTSSIWFSTIRLCLA